ncbi:hypothetical protein MTP99_003702 [Tenebrio molitor]|nr:hypothetical protein MTP99_003702 [Tenebrio molitor]
MERDRQQGRSGALRYLGGDIMEDQGYTEETQNVTERYYERFGKSGEDGDLEELEELQDQRAYQNQQNESQVSVSTSINFYKMLAIELTNPKIRYDFDYEAKSKMFLLSIDTSGHTTVILHNVTYDVTFIFEEHTKENKKYFQLYAHTITEIFNGVH